VWIGKRVRLWLCGASPESQMSELKLNTTNH